MWLARRGQRAMNTIRARGLQTYLKTIQAIRVSGIGLIGLFIMLQLMAMGLFVFTGAAIFLTGWDTETKLWIILGIGGFVFIFALFTLCFLLSERLWYKLSGAEKLVQDTIQKVA